MNWLETKEQIEKITSFSILLKEAIENNDKLFDKIEELNVEYKDRLYKKYENSDGPVIGIRKEVAEGLLRNNIDRNYIVSRFEIGKKENPKQFTQYKNLFSVLYPFVTAENNKQVYATLTSLGESLRRDLNITSFTSLTVVGFDGARNTGDDHAWFAIYNNKHPNQTTAKQLFFSLHNGSVTYALYDRINDKMMDTELVSANSLEYETLLHFYEKHIDVIKKDFQHNTVPILEDIIINKSHEINNNDNTQNNSVTDINIPLNQILYGPPGTGKTYHTINKALEILGYDFEGKERLEIKKHFEEKIKSGQIVFTTFHQNLSYEDFIEGLKPIEPKKEGNPIIYKVVDGIFKQMCYNSLPFKTGDDLNGYIVEAVSKDLVTFTKKRSGHLLPVSIRMLYALKSYYDTNNLDYKSELNLTDDQKTKYPELEPYLINGYKTIIPFALNALSNFTKNNEPKILIIDEINRGNVSQIFGELITLIEKDKRLGNSEELTVTLPYSKTDFGVPNNLYIIGTMNTADRSVEALDSALRRRFVFEEMSPKPEKIANIRKEKKLDEKIADINLDLLLSTINHRVEKLLDRDHTIGHSYFLDCKDIKDLKDTFYKNIIPLLQEYFYGDYAKKGLVLGAGFIQVKNDTTSFAAFEHDSIDIFNDRKVYEIVDYRCKSGLNKIILDKIEQAINFEQAIKILLNQEAGYSNEGQE